MLRLYSAPVCPFAQRTRALLVRLETEFEMVPVDLDDRDPELLARSPTGKVPFLVDGDFTLYESDVINDYLAASLGWDGAYSADLRVRTLQKLAMKQWDAAIGTAFYRSLRRGPLSDDERAILHRELAWWEKTVDAMDGELDNMVALHSAPFWARMRWVGELSEVAEHVGEHRRLRAWLDAAIALPPIVRTLPDEDETVTRYREKFAGRP